MVYRLRWIQRYRNIACNAPPLFCIWGEEPYFLPHFLSHYRGLGVEEFILYLDRPSEATLAALAGQPDVALITSELPFGHPLGKHHSGAHYRWHHLLRDRFTDQQFAGRWALTVDADEFLVLPSEYPDLASFCRALQGRGLVHCSAGMVDFHPERLSGRHHDPSFSPFQGSPWFDAGPYFRWHPPALVPELVHAGVRQRITQRLAAGFPREWQRVVGPNYAYQPPKCWKVPLILHGRGVRRDLIHEASRTPPADVLCALAHFKFYPGIDAKVAQALARGEYYRTALEYRILDLAFRLLEHESLLCGRSRRWQGTESLEAAGLLGDPLRS